MPSNETTELDRAPSDENTDRFPFDHVFLLLLTADGARLLRLRRGDAVVFGRAEDCDVVVDDSRVSRRHARVAFLGNTLVVRDLGSRNGTRLGERLLRDEQAEITDGSLVGIGPLRAVVGVTVSDPGASEETIGEAAPELMEGFLASSPLMTDLLRRSLRVAKTRAVVLIHGETGSGKEVLGEQIHRWSAAAGGPFLSINCAAVPRELIESELFGHERGAFTGANQRKIGFLEAASKGSLLLDEVGELSLEGQAKLLRALETRTITRLGGTEPVRLETRFLCATHRNLAAEVAAGRFREDLWFRINTFVLEVPPLRARPMEALTLASLFANRFAKEHGLTARPLSLAAVEALLRHDWPGNVRELRNAMEHAVVLARGASIEVIDLPDAVRSSSRESSEGDTGQETGLRGELADLERERVEQALRVENGNQTRAAERLGISRRGLIRKLEKYGFKPKAG